MEQVNVSDRIQITQVRPNDDQDLLHKFGRVMIITDDVNCVIAIDEGGVATVDISQVKKVN
jgi:hypothetical protein